MEQILNKYRQVLSYPDIQHGVNQVLANAQELLTDDIKRQLFTFIDLTFLNTTDNHTFIRKMTEKVNQVSHKFGLDNVGGLCVYPRFVETVDKNLTDRNVRVVSVVGGFPASQTFLEVKKLETELAIRHGANEVDMVISVGEFLDQNYQLVYDEVKALKEVCGNDAKLKVILESGVLDDFAHIYKAAVLAMEAGADFIKTSTGKEKVGATPEAGYVMALAIKDYYDISGRRVGFKPAGGVSTSDKAVIYYAIVKELLGEDWLVPDLFRIGSSGLANKLLKELGMTEEDFFSAKAGY